MHNLRFSIAVLYTELSSRIGWQFYVP